MKTFKKAFAMFLCLIMALGLLATTASAAESATIDKDATGSITITKYENTEETPLAGVEFTLYKVMDADALVNYYKADSSTKVTVNDYVENKAIKSGVAIGTPQAETTNANGVATFSSLPVGLYVVIETKYPDKVTKPCDPFLVSLPMVNPTNPSAWEYNINVKPKNSTSIGNITLKKTDATGNPMPGVEFTLERYQGNSWGPYVFNNKNKFTTNDSGEIVFSGMPHGKYRVTETKTLDGYILDARPIEFTVNEDNTATAQIDNSNRLNVTTSETNGELLITVRNEKKPTIRKKINNLTGETDLVPIGGEVKFRVSVDVPWNVNAMTTFKITDTPSSLKVENLNSVVVTCYHDSSTETLNGNNYFTIARDASGNGYELTFNTTSLSGLRGFTLNIDYSATVQQVMAQTNAGKNTATLTYTDVLGTDSTDTVSADATAHLHAISITKRKDSVDGNLLQNVEFELYSDAALTQKMNFASKNGRYVPAVGEDTIATLTTDPNGGILIHGLAKGTYYLKETKTNAGLNLLSEPIIIEVSEEVDSDYIISMNVINKSGFTLPQTGGMGTLLFILIGGVLIAGGVFLMTRTGKKRAQ